MTDSTVHRVYRTAALLERRGYALPPARLGQLCAGGRLEESEVRLAVAASPDLEERAGLVVARDTRLPVEAVAARRRCHLTASGPFLDSAVRFAGALTAASPHVLCVAVAGSLASGGFRDSDDVDLNIIVEDGSRHLAYVALNLLGGLHALLHRGKPVDAHTRRPLAPRLMTANLILERSECFPLARRDEDMAYELLVSEPVMGGSFYREVLEANPALLDHFPQLADKGAPQGAPLAAPAPRRLPPALQPLWLEPPARGLARAGWRAMQWTRRRRPEALARVAYVRSTMRPYVLFPDL